MTKKESQTNENQTMNEEPHPEIAAIDHNANLEPIEKLMTIFSAYNHQHRADGTAWSVWPDWELVLTSMEDDLQIVDARRDTPEIIAEREHWLNVMQFIDDSDAVTLDEYTLIVDGIHGHQFTFDMCLEYEYWVSPRSLAEHYKKTNENKTGSLGPPWKRNTMLYFTRHDIEHPLGEYWVCPDHVSEYGGQSTRYTHSNRFCIDKDVDDIFPLALFSLIQMCIDDTEIWKMMFEQDMRDIEHHEFMETEWPGGRPDQDWEYQ